MPAYRILSLDGGGIRGLLTVVLLERLEAERPGLLSQIDLIAGTSTGAILALGLAHGLSPTELRRLYEEEGKDIFAESLWHTVLDLGFARGAKYSNRPLKRALQERFGDRTLAQLGKKVLVASFDLDNAPHHLGEARRWKAKFFHNYPGSDSDGHEHVVDVALRSSAAPTYFPVYQGYVDGFVVANNPSMCALAQALNSETLHLEDVSILSIGTGLNLRYLPQQDADWGWSQWMFQLHPLQRDWYTMPLIYMMWEGGVELANYQCRQLLREHFHRLDPVLPEVVDIDDVGKLKLLAWAGEATQIGDTLTWLDDHYLGQK